MKNILFIEGGACADIKKALVQWIDLSSDILGEGLTFELYKDERGKHIIKADDNLSNEQFNYLLNYLKYPEDIEYKINITGYTTITKPTVFPAKRMGEEILIFIPESDDEYDNVYWVTKDSQVYKTDFGGTTIESDISKTFEEAEFNSSEYPPPEIFYSRRVSQPEPEPVDEAESERKISKRFKIISVIIAALIAVSLFFYNDPLTFIKMNRIIGFGTAFWFFCDDKMLRLNKYFNLSFLIAIIIAFYGYQVRHSPPLFYKFVGNLELVLSIPLIFLTVQKLLRIGFKTIMKREPGIERPIRRFADFIYLVLLIGATVLICQLIPRTAI
ncbi:MAG TPA: hypothetical protein VK483_17595 [Chitinophagaceae bacterium]|nr:hypothetical protein [Chitinophagaceae bacterium]